MSQPFSTFNFVNLKNIEVSLVKSTPCNTCQNPKHCSKHSCWTLLQWYHLWYHLLADGNTCNIHSCWLQDNLALVVKKSKDNCGYSRNEKPAYAFDDKVMASMKAWYLQHCHLQTRRRENMLPGTDQALAKNNSSSRHAVYPAPHLGPTVKGATVMCVTFYLSCQNNYLSEKSKNEETKEPSWTYSCRSQLGSTCVGLLLFCM